jgi:hypothetical protein
MHYCGPPQNTTLGITMTVSHEILLHTANLYITVLRKFVETGEPLQAESLISSASRMAGTLMFRTFTFDLSRSKPGEVVLSEEANSKGAHLTNLVNVTLEGLGDKVDVEKAKASLDVSAISRWSLLETQSRFEPLFRAIAKTVGLSLPEAGAAASIASGILVHESPPRLDMDRAYIIAIYGHIEALKKVPAHLQEKGEVPPSGAAATKSRRFKFW